MYNTTPIADTQAGSLFNITFHILPGTHSPGAAVQLVSSVTPLGHQYSTEVADATGQLVLSAGMDELAIQTGTRLAVHKDLAGRPRGRIR